VELEGTLDLFPLRELIEMSIYSSVIGVLNLTGQRGAGQIFFRDGVVYHCAYGGLTGEEALVLLFEERDASFKFVADATTAAATLWGGSIELIERCELLAARWRSVRALLPNTNVVPHLVSNPGHANLSIETAHFAMLAGIDGQRTLDEIAADLHLDLLDVCEATIQLSQDNLIHLTPAPPRPVAKPAANSASGGVIDRILATLPSVAPPGSTAAAPNPAPVRSAEEEYILRLLRS